MTVQFLSQPTYDLAYTYQPVDNAPTVLFLPGYFSDMAGTKALFLKDQSHRHGYGFLSLDYSGHGQSGGQFIDGTISSWLNDTLAVLDHTQAKNLIVVGSSMGGWLMLLLATKRPHLIRKLVGIAAAPDFTEDLIWQKLSEAKRHLLESKGCIYTPSAYSAQGTPLAYTLILDGRKNLLLRTPITLSVPVRLIHGTADKDVPYETSIKIMEKLESKDVHVRLIKDGDHRLSSPDQLQILWETVIQ
ncbi:MAG: alpha/beta hydrolase [Candidatus Paracaedibacteraceae bacterium]|nr:alpha/beta hydrolase [Candidatus Paracaedibacteraceae bacterium]